MTLIGKLLAFLNLLAGLGILSWSVLVYTQRPGWLDPIPENINPGQNPENFKQMQAEIDTLARTAKAASDNWGTQRKILEKLEKTQGDRLKQYEERLKWAKTGNPEEKGNAFFEPVYEKDSGMLDLATLGKPIKGSDNLPLKGSETLLANFNTDVAEVAKYAEQIVMQRNAFAKISIDIRQTEDRLLKITEIREAVQSELFYLETFEVNVYETRETVLRRKKQLDVRIAELTR
jgi:hypothetical protein